MSTKITVVSMVTTVTYNGFEEDGTDVTTTKREITNTTLPMTELPELIDHINESSELNDYEDILYGIVHWQTGDEVITKKRVELYADEELDYQKRAKMEEDYLQGQNEQVEVEE